MAISSAQEGVYAEAVARGEIIPSWGKEQGWHSYISSLQDLLAVQQPAASELKRLHILMAGHYASFSLPDSWKEGMETHLYTLDRPDGAKEELRAANITDLAERKRFLRRMCEKDTKINLDVQPVGNLRSYGTRRINGVEELVFASHTCAFESNTSALFDRDDTELYLGLSADLDKVYETLCLKYDNLRREAKTFDGALQAELFLQLWGARVLHPFWDGNGRTFGAHLALMLERQGIQVRDFQDQQGLVRALTSPSDDFLKSVLNNAGLRLLSVQAVENINVSPSARQNYMKLLRTELERGISAGLNAADEYTRQIKRAAYLVKKELFGCSLMGADKLSDKEKAIIDKEERLNELFHEDQQFSAEWCDAREEVTHKFGEALSAIIGLDFFTPTLEAQVEASAKELSPELGRIKVFRRSEKIIYDLAYMSRDCSKVYANEGGFSLSAESFKSIDELLAKAIKDGALTKETAQLLEVAMKKAEQAYPRAEAINKVNESMRGRSAARLDARTALKSEISALEEEICQTAA
ncbi:MAG: hypothetical protein HYT16_03610 [DPANN group archaeon]|nr:hypothetical protein [DPANN group archaeon]